MRSALKRPRVARITGLGSLLLLLPLAGSAAEADSDTAVTPVQQRAFRLGYALQTPAARTEAFLQTVKGLKTITDDVQGVSEVGKLAKQSERLRAVEQRAYRQTAQMLGAMGAPPDLQAWAGGVAYRLGTPLALSKDAKGFLESDPNTAQVLGTIDEAQAIATEADHRRPGLIAWLKITNGAAAVWASDLGGLAAGMHTAVATDRSLYLSRTEPLKLRNAAPFGTPGPVLDALSVLSPSTGNLAGLIRLPAALVPPKQVRGPQDTLLGAYGGRLLADQIDKGP